MVEELEIFDFAPVSTVRLREYQESAIASVEASWNEASRLLMVMATGCFQRGTMVLLADGSTKPVEAIRVGDRLIGDDGDWREVVSLKRGRDTMYRITPTKGESHVVNAGHILTLVKTPKRKGVASSVIDISLLDYMRQTTTQKHLQKVFRSEQVEFHGQTELLPINPYFLGIYLGDGSCSQSFGRWTLQHAATITTEDEEIAHEVYRVASDFGLRVRVSENRQPNKSKNYHIVGKITGRSNRPKNAVSQIIRHLGVNVTSGFKFIPDSYKRASISSRLEILAGLMDTDGSLTTGGFDYISKSERLANDVAFVARSLGLAAYVKSCIKGCQTGVKGTYYRVSISGDCSIIPCRIPRKKAPVRCQIKNVLRTGFTVEELPKDNYYGFSLAGKNGRFLLADFTVTHNTGKTVVFSKISEREVAKGGRTLILAHTDELLEQAIDKLRRATGIEAEKEKADEHASPFASVVVASVQTLARENRLTGFADNHFTLVIVDECHRSLAASYQRILCYFHFGAKSLEDDWKMPVPGEPFTHHARILGVTATADRGDKRSLGEFYQKVAFEYGLLEAVRDGYLVRPIVKNIGLKFDVKGVRKTGGDYDSGEVAERIRPFISAGAEAIRLHAWDRKTVVFMPSIETSKMLADACTAIGMNASFVSGQCNDRTEKIAAFDKAGTGAVIACAMLLIEGWDCDTVSCVSVWRPTKVRALFTQAVGRCTRTLTGLIDGLENPDERLAAIKASSKPDMLILDPLWLTDRLDLIKPVDLVARTPEVREKMLADGNADLVASEATAERDLLASLEKAAKKHSRKTARTIDPLAWAVSLGDASLAGYEPETPFDELPPHPGQLEILARNGIDTAGINCRGLAAKIVDRIVVRKQLGLCSPKQMRFLIQLGMKDEEAALITEGKAGAIIGARARHWR